MRFCWIVLFFLEASLSAYVPQCFLDFEAGLRTDWISSNSEAFDAAGTLISTDQIRVQHNDGYSIGLNGRYPITDCFYLRGFALYGSAVQRSSRSNLQDAPPNQYTETSTSVPTGTISVIRAVINRSTTTDANFGVGYQYPLYSSWGIGPVLGFGYDFQRVRIIPSLEASSNVNLILLPFINGTVFLNQWKGPWLGLDLSYSSCCYSLNIGYEYHWAAWKASWRMKARRLGNQVINDIFDFAFSDHRRSPNAHGQVIFVENRWVYGDWNIGLGIRAQQWIARNGKLNPSLSSFSGVSSTVRSVNVKSAAWSSVYIYLNFGFNF